LPVQASSVVALKCTGSGRKEIYTADLTIGLMFYKSMQGKVMVKLSFLGVRIVFER
jgi:hypothetical protein